jgi:hypothetical protein
MLVYHPHILLDAVDHVHTGQTALHKIAQKLHDANSADEKARYVQCLHILVSSSSIQSRDPGSSTTFSSVNVNAQDAFGNTSLHYAALSGIHLKTLLRIIKASSLLSQALNIMALHIDCIGHGLFNNTNPFYRL